LLKLGLVFFPARLETVCSMPQCEFFLLRYVPDAVKNEFVNIGVVLLEREGAGFADVRFARDWHRVRCLDPDADTEMLAALEQSVRQQIAQAENREKFLRIMNESFSGTIQVSAPSACLTEAPAREIEELARLYVETAARAARGRELSGRPALVQRMREEFERTGVWARMHKRIAAAEYTHPGDPLKLDCGYQPNGVVRLFHAVSLASDVDAAKVLAFSFPQIAAGIARKRQAETEFTAIVEDDLDRQDENVAFAVTTLERTAIRVAPAAELPELAERARRELRV
jgi:hypothetical protein